MKIVAVILGALIMLIQYPLWLGKGGWLRASEVDRQLSVQKAKNGELARRTSEQLASGLREAGYEPVEGGI